MPNYYNCVDVSEWNGDIDWSAAVADDVKFAFIRCGFGRDSESQDDKYFDINMRNALEAGVKVGVYFYSYAKSAEDAASEAAHCLRLIEPYRKQMSFPIFYDVEEASIEDYVSETVPVFTNLLKNAGYNVGVYATGYWFTHCLQYVAIDFLWIAYWGSDDGVPHSKPDYADVWQYTSRGSVNGIGSGCVDCDILYNEEMTALIDQSDDDGKDDDGDDEDEVKTVDIEMNIIKQGDRGNQVETLQILLNAFGFRDEDGNELVVDSIFGPKTDYAVRSYQAARDIEADGEVGFQTWSRLLK